MKRHPTLLVDTLVLVVLALLVVVIGIKTIGGGSGYVEVRTYEGIYRYALDADRQLSVSGPLGPTQILIEGGKARITDSSCPTKSCVHQKPIEGSGGWIACLPNQVLLTIVGESAEMEVDDVAI